MEEITILEIMLVNGGTSNAVTRDIKDSVLDVICVAGGVTAVFSALLKAYSCMYFPIDNHRARLRTVAIVSGSLMALTEYIYYIIRKDFIGK